MAAAAQAFNAWLESWVAHDFPTFRARSREVSAQSWATIRSTMVCDLDGHDEPWLKVFVRHPAVGSVMGWPSDVLLLPVFQQLLCSLPVLAVATVLGMGEMEHYDRSLRRVIRQRCMAVQMGSKQLKLVRGDNAPGRVAAGLLSLPDGDANASVETRLTLNPLHLELVVEAQSGGQ